MNHTTPWPRVCAHRGLSARLPANSLEALEAGFAEGAQEIEFDLRPARDGRLVLRHDPLYLLSPGKIARLPAFEDVLERLGGRVIMNIHVKVPGAVAGVVEAIGRFNCRDSVYITGGGGVMQAALTLAPGIERCCLEGHMNYTIVKNAVRHRARKVQFFKPFFNRAMIAEAHAHGIRCNVYFADDPEEARRYFRMGMDTVLTNNCVKILPVLHPHISE